ncbi:MAG: BCD family MFS transporter [Sphingomonadales bacterium]|nr:BCD family MFS transporter [Sphingomonadales bacterium]PIX64751.1 MAG: MFS transporter [Sphingomonadales bacterium CG_4_10_14_3_um_filter_58_15]NCO48839.1 BCD family MFS transporter [Sphingomonadales bacterium]NCP01171.1 BCD family MFS transporter [Sphingomonadales bacterium]NCP27027.1 BCD family MFS transporter [Sphingomonadales bacterium]
MNERPSAVTFWQAVGTRFLPFADAASGELPLGRLLRLALFQVSVGLAAVLLNGTLNRVLIVELDTPTWIVALMIAIPLLVAPFRALIGYRSDTHRSVLGWRRVPYIWFGTLAQFGGLAIMPFALILITRPDTFVLGVSAACLSFLLTGAGMHVTQTAGLALATDIAPDDKRPRVVALLYVMLLVGMMLAAFTIGNLLTDFTATKLVQVIQGAGALTMALNIIALWKQEARNTRVTMSTEVNPSFSEIWASFTAQPNTKRLLLAIGLGAMAFAMQDALLEPYGGQILALSVGSTTALTGTWALGALVAFAYSGKRLAAGADPLRLAGLGAVAGIAAFLMTIFAAPLLSVPLLFAGATVIGFGVGLFSVGTMIAAMGLSGSNNAGLALGAWGAVQASCAGLGIALGGLIRDGVAYFALADGLGATLADRATGYGTVFCLEIILLLVTMIVLGPVIGRDNERLMGESKGFGLSEFPT